MREYWNWKDIVRQVSEIPIQEEDLPAFVENVELNFEKAAFRTTKIWTTEKRTTKRGRRKKTDPVLNYNG